MADPNFDADFDAYIEARGRNQIIKIPDQELTQLQMYAVISCLIGLVFVSFHSTLESDLYLSAIWFIFGILANICGFLSTAVDFFERPLNMRINSYLLLQYDYIFSWLAIVVGYPPMVACIWVNHCQCNYARLLMLYPAIPLYYWYRDEDIVLPTQVIAVLTIVSHVYISCLTLNLWGIVGACIVSFNVYALSIQPSHTLYGYNPRESFIIGLTISSTFLAVSVGQTSWFPTKLNSTLPWNIFTMENYI